MQSVIRAALNSAGMRAAQVVGLQMHGTGTPLGDPIVSERGACARALCSTAVLAAWVFFLK